MTLQEISMFLRRVETAMRGLDAERQADLAQSFDQRLAEQRAYAAFQAQRASDMRACAEAERLSRFDFDMDTAEMLEGAS